MFDYRTSQLTRLADIKDGTRNTIMVGEVLPYQTADSNFYMLYGGTAGVTVPLNWKTPRFPCTDNLTFGSADWQCRFSYASKGFKSEHTGGANFLFGDGSVKFLKQTISPIIYAALGSKNGGEVISADQY